VPSIAPSRDPGTKAGASPNLSITHQTTKVVSTGVLVPLREDRYAAGVVVEQKYQLVRLLGEGGMGSVWVAKNLTLDAHVALKLMRSDLAQTVPGAAERMLTEARAAASIHHPAIVQIFDFGRTRDGDPYISMELLDGESLSGTLKRRERVSPTKAIQVLLPIADALVVAHGRGVVHRDLKPDNVFLARLADGRVQPKILDFGIAKREASGAPKLTLDGTVLGSPAYMSPEQARGQSDIDHRVDVWAFSVMLYELVTGCLPFAGESYNALLFSIVSQEPLSLMEHGVNEPELWAILARGMDKDRDKRFPSIRALGRELARYLLDRKVKTDIAQGALRPWLDPSVRPQALPSLFASLAPSEDGTERPPTVHPAKDGDVDALLQLMGDVAPATQLSADHDARTPAEIRADAERARAARVKVARGATTIGRKRALNSRLPGPLAKIPRWAWFAGPAAAAFVISLGVSFARSPASEAAKVVPTADVTLAPKPAPPPAAMTARPRPQPTEAEQVAAAIAPSADTSVAKAAKPSVRSTSAPRTSAPRTTSRKPAARAELKNPFAH
jgi:serine/threonine-protein kinase